LRYGPERSSLHKSAENAAQLETFAQSQLFHILILRVRSYQIQVKFSILPFLSAFQAFAILFFYADYQDTGGVPPFGGQARHPA
jgi:hypothetical protein